MYLESFLIIRNTVTVVNYVTLSIDLDLFLVFGRKTGLDFCNRKKKYRYVSMFVAVLL